MSVEKNNFLQTAKWLIIIIVAIIGLAMAAMCWMALLLPAHPG